VDSPRAQAILPSVAAAIWIGGLESDLRAAADRAKMAISSGRASEKLEELIRASEGE
jgi:anthranilate phosphoribosyltransferase